MKEKDQRIQVLTNEIEVVLMTKSEFISLSEGGEMKELKQQFQWRKDKTTKDPTRDPLENKQKTKRKPVGFDITGCCKPTSLKIKMENLVTDKGNAIKMSRHQKELWDRPVPPPNHQWIRDIDYRWN
jgi:hypothetical protein